jgi:hypothetical protein
MSSKGEVMQAIKFLCPDGKEELITDCLKSCRMKERCMTRPTLIHISEQREWKGYPSTTQCLNGTRQEFLKLTNDFTIDPQDRAFMFLGSVAHYPLEKADSGESLNEEKFTGTDVSGMADHYDGEEQTLWDYKTSGSYKAASAMGVVSKKVVDPSGAVYARAGKGYAKGDPKMITEFSIDPEKADCKDWELQLNRYRIFFEAAGFPVKKIKIQIIVRDGNTYIAKNRGIDKNIYIVPIRILPDEEVLSYFKAKSEALVHAMETGELPDYCTEDERWNNMRCERFCDVAHICKPSFLNTENK